MIKIYNKLVLVLVVVLCISSLAYLIPLGSSYTGTITYDVTTNIMRAIGGNVTNQITFEDLYQADVANSWGVVTKQGIQQYLFNCRLIFGDNTTNTYFYDTTKQIEFTATSISGAAQSNIQVFNKANATFGKLISLTTHITADGCSFISNDNYTSTSIILQSAGATLGLYSCQFNVPNALSHYIPHAFPSATAYCRIYNCVFLQSCILYMRTTFGDIYNLMSSDTTVSGKSNGLVPSGMASTSMQKIYVMNYYQVFGVASNANDSINDATFVGLSRTGAVASSWSGTVNLTDVTSNVWQFAFLGSSNGTINRLYTFDLSVLNSSATGFIENANVTIIKNNVFIGSWLTNSSGQIPEQILRYGFYNYTGGNVAYEASYPLDITITAPNFNSYNCKFFLTEKTKMTVCMQNQTAPPANNYTVARFNWTPSNPSTNQTVTFDASTSSNSTAITSYLWDFGDNSTTVNSTNPTVTHDFGELGVFNVTLTISASEVSSVVQALTVGNEMDYIALAIAAAIICAVVACVMVLVLVKKRDE